MKMGNRKNKQIDRYCSRASTKTKLTGRPTNRAEKRRFQHVLKREHISEDEINQEALLQALKEHRSG